MTPEPQGKSSQSKAERVGAFIRERPVTSAALAVGVLAALGPARTLRWGVKAMTIASLTRRVADGMRDAPQSDG